MRGSSDRLATFLCTACGTSFPPAAEPPEQCSICSDERQFVPESGQSWTSTERLRRNHFASFRAEADVLGIGISPQFAIGQRALLIRTGSGNILWDCIPLVSPELVELLRGLGGIRAIAISHPHFYSAMGEWSRSFGDIPVYLHGADRPWVVNPDGNLVFWEGEEFEIGVGMTLIRTGGHFEGSTVLHWADGASRRGALFTGDSLQVVPDRRHVGFMRSYPNLVPLGAAAVRTIADRLLAYPFDAVYGGFWGRVIAAGGHEALQSSARRHIEWVNRS